MFSNNVDFKSKSQLSRQERGRFNIQEFFFWEVALCSPVLLSSWGMEVASKQVVKKKEHEYWNQGSFKTFPTRIFITFNLELIFTPRETLALVPEKTNRNGHNNKLSFLYSRHSPNGDNLSTRQVYFIELSNEDSSNSFIQSCTIHVDCSTQRQDKLAYARVNMVVFFKAAYGGWQSCRTTSKTKAAEVMHSTVINIYLAK